MSNIKDILSRIRESAEKPKRNRIDECLEEVKSCVNRDKYDVWGWLSAITSNKLGLAKQLEDIVKEFDAFLSEEDKLIIRTMKSKEECDILALLEVMKNQISDCFPEDKKEDVQQKIAIIAEAVGNQAKMAKDIEKALKDELSKIFKEGTLEEDYTFLKVADGKAEIRSEADYDTMFDIAERLTKVIEKYDEDSYFDMETAGIIAAYFGF